MGVDRLHQAQVQFAHELEVTVDLFQHRVDDQCFPAAPAGEQVSVSPRGLVEELAKDHDNASGCVAAAASRCGRGVARTTPALACRLRASFQSTVRSPARSYRPPRDLNGRRDSPGLQSAPTHTLICQPNHLKFTHDRGSSWPPKNRLRKVVRQEHQSACRRQDRRSPAGALPSDRGAPVSVPQLHASGLVTNPGLVTNRSRPRT